MKKVIYILIVLVSFISCKKDKKNNQNEDTDLRDKYIGKYQAHYTANSYGFPECGPPHSSAKDTIISVYYGNSDSTIVLLGREVKLDVYGNYSAYHYGLQMRNDSIFSNFMNGGLGCGVYENYVGYRISEKP